MEWAPYCTLDFSLLGCVYLVSDSKKPGKEDAGLMSVTMPRTKAFVLYVQLF